MAAQDYIDLLGKRARDKVTKFEGVVVSMGFDLYGCVQAVLAPPLDKDGKMQDGRWFDVNRLEIVDHERVMPVPQFGRPFQPVTYGATPALHTHGPAEKPERQ